MSDAGLPEIREQVRAEVVRQAERRGVWTIGAVVQHVTHDVCSTSEVRVEELVRYVVEREAQAVRKSKGADGTREWETVRTRDGEQIAKRLAQLTLTEGAADLARRSDGIRADREEFARRARLHERASKVAAERGLKPEITKYSDVLSAEEIGRIWTQAA